MPDEATPFANISRRVVELARARGLTLRRSTYDIGPDAKSSLGVTFVFTLTPDFDPKEPDAFDEIVKGEEAIEAERIRNAKADAAREQLQHLRDTLKNPDEGIGL